MAEKDYWKVFAFGIPAIALWLWAGQAGMPWAIFRSPILVLVLICVGVGLWKLVETLWLMARKKGAWEPKDD